MGSGQEKRRRGRGAQWSRGQMGKAERFSGVQQGSVLGQR
jgi:hypothetical protein